MVPLSDLHFDQRSARLERSATRSWPELQLGKRFRYCSAGSVWRVAIARRFLRSCSNYDHVFAQFLLMRINSVSGKISEDMPRLLINGVLIMQARDVMVS